MAGGASAGIYSVSFRGQRGVAVGGDYAVPDAADRNAGWTADGRTGTTHRRARAGTGRARHGSTATGAVARCSRSARPARTSAATAAGRGRRSTPAASTAWSASEAARATPPVRRVGWPSCAPADPAPCLHPTCGLRRRRGPDPGRGGGTRDREGVSARRGTLPAARAPRGAGGSGRGSGRAGGRSSA